MTVGHTAAGNAGASSDAAPILDRAATGLEDSTTGGWRIELASGDVWWSPETFVICGVDPAGFTPSLERIGALVDERTAVRLRDIRSWIQACPGTFAAGYWITLPHGDRRLIEVRGWCADDHRSIAFGTCRDVTDIATQRAEGRRMHRRQATILDAAGDGICGLDLEGRITFTNPALLRLMRREGEDLGGRRLHDLVHRDAEGRENHPAGDCPFHAGERRPAGATDPAFHRGDGSRIEVGYMLVAFEDHSDRGAVVSFRDVTARRAAARLLKSSLRQVQTLSAQRGALLGHLAEAEERERLRIAADIHDDTIQALGAVALRLSNAGEHAAGEAERELLTTAERDVRGVAEGLRRLMFELMPPGDGGDLRSALETYCDVLFAASPIEWEIVGEVGELPAERSLVAYRLLQEALRNARTHSRGTRVQVTLENDDGELRLRVSDDGVGMGDFDAPPTHAGLRIVRQRAEAAGGSARFDPGPDGRGSCIELRLPPVEASR